MRRRKAKKREKPDPIAKRNRRFRIDIRTAFTNSGFLQIATRDVQFSHAGFTTDFDGIYCKENVLVIVEDTTENDPANHLRKKAAAWAGMDADREAFVTALISTFPALAKYLNENATFEIHDYAIRFVYVSYNRVDELLANRHSTIAFLDNAKLQYFVSLSKTVSRSTIYEMLSFLKLKLDDVGISRSAASGDTYKGLYLPETPSGFTAGHKIVSLLMDPATLLERSYVLRADGWRDSDALYQRLLVKSKIKEMRQYLKQERRVFVNNVIVTFPDETKLTTADGKTISATDGAKRDIEAVEITLPRRLACIGIIDGQHRIFSYHEGTDDLDGYIASLRNKQHLLVTGIVYPKSIAQHDKEQFEAKLFLEINDKQKRVRGDLKQAIERIVRPRSALAIAKSVVDALALTAPFNGYLQSHAFDTGKLKTTSIVSYGIRYVVDPKREDSLFGRWAGPQKGEFPIGDQFSQRVYSLLHS